MLTEVAFAEAARVLAEGGRYAACEPWRAPLYGVGTRIIGKRDRDVNCRPLDAQRAQPVYSAFARAEVVHHGALTRYPLLALSKAGLRFGADVNRRIMDADDVLASFVPRLRAAGSSCVLLAEKA
jgi:hypothetical protein